MSDSEQDEPLPAGGDDGKTGYPVRAAPDDPPVERDKPKTQGYPLKGAAAPGDLPIEPDKPKVEGYPLQGAAPPAAPEPKVEGGPKG